MLKYIEFRVDTQGVKIEVTDAHVDKETDKIIWLQWEKNRRVNRKLLKTELNKIINYHSYGWAMKNIHYQCWCPIDMVSVMIKLMYAKSLNIIELELEERKATYAKLQEWGNKPTYNVGLIKRGEVKNL